VGAACAAFTLKEVNMKTLTTLTAVAAMIAGISIASAQTSSMDKSDTMGSSSTQATGSGKFCIKGASGALNCQYASLSACQKAVKGSETCSPNPNSGTTGSKY
jgi:phage I-like protein